MLRREYYFCKGPATASFRWSIQLRPKEKTVRSASSPRATGATSSPPSNPLSSPFLPLRRRWREPPGKARVVPAAAGLLFPARLGICAGRSSRRRCGSGRCVSSPTSGVSGAAWVDLWTARAAALCTAADGGLLVEPRREGPDLGCSGPGRPAAA
jgi:hypothetical protein